MEPTNAPTHEPTDEPTNEPIHQPDLRPSSEPTSGFVSVARRSLAAAWPIMAGYVVLGIPCGILCSAAGMEVWMCAVLSLVFYSGAGQYMIPNMWLAANPVSAIIASVCLVNTRQMLYGTALARFCSSAGKGLATLFAATVTDESFGVNYARFSQVAPAVGSAPAAESAPSAASVPPAELTPAAWTVREALGVNLWSQATWTLANVAGALLGAAISVPTALASFAMTSLFICLLCMQRFDKPNVAAMLGAVLGVVACKLAGLGGVAILVGAVIGVLAGFAVSSTPAGRGGGRSCR